MTPAVDTRILVLLVLRGPLDLLGPLDLMSTHTQAMTITPGITQLQKEIKVIVESQVCQEEAHSLTSTHSGITSKVNQDQKERRESQVVDIMTLAMEQVLELQDHPDLQVQKETPSLAPQDIQDHRVLQDEAMMVNLDLQGLLDLQGRPSL